jgi:cytochrome b561
MTQGRQAPYDAVAIALHWALGLALIAQIAFGFALDTLAPRGSPARTDVINLHKSTGIVLGALIVLRLAWRLRHAPPTWSAALSGLHRRGATLGHRALYACMLLMPLSGYVASNFSRHGVRFFGHVWQPWGPDLPAAYTFFNGVHVVTAFVFAALVIGHVAFAVWHAAVRRDGVFERMWPGSRVVAPSSNALDPARPHP